MTIILPGMTGSNERISITPTDDSESLLGIILICRIIFLRIFIANEELLTI